LIDDLSNQKWSFGVPDSSWISRFRRIHDQALGTLVQYQRELSTKILLDPSRNGNKRRQAYSGILFAIYDHDQVQLPAYKLVQSQILEVAAVRQLQKRTGAAVKRTDDARINS